MPFLSLLFGHALVSSLVSQNLVFFLGWPLAGGAAAGGQKAAENVKKNANSAEGERANAEDAPHEELEEGKSKLAKSDMQPKEAWKVIDLDADADHDTIAKVCVPSTYSHHSRCALAWPHTTLCLLVAFPYIATRHLQ
jgi:hypothetical protein